MCTENQLHIISETVASEAKRLLGEKLSAVVLYGSYARGDHDDESDIDIMVIVKCATEELSRFRHLLTSVSSRLSLEYGVTVSVTIADAESFDRYGSFLPFYININREGIRIA